MADTGSMFTAFQGLMKAPKAPVKSSQDGTPSPTQEAEHSKVKFNLQKQHKTGKKLTYVPASPKQVFTFKFQPFTSLEEMRRLPPTINTGKARPLGISSYLPPQLAQQLVDITAKEREKALSKAKKHRRNISLESEEDQGAAGVFESRSQSSIVPDDEDQNPPSKSDAGDSHLQEKLPYMSEVQAPTTERTAYGEKDILQRANVYSNRESIKFYKRFWKLWKGEIHLEQYTGPKNKAQTMEMPETEEIGTFAQAELKKPKEDKEGVSIEFESVPAPSKLTRLIPNCNNLYKPKSRSPK